jgi:hypothetical protein
MPPTKIANFDAKKVSFTKPEKNEKYSKSQKMGFSRYDEGGNVVFQTQNSKLCQYGITPLGEYCATDADRDSLKTPYNLDNVNDKLLHDKLTEVDLMVKNKYAHEWFGAKYDNYRYYPIVRDPYLIDLDEIEDDAEREKAEKKNSEKLKYTKIKLDIDFNTKKIKTLIYRKLSKEEQEETGKKREQVPVETMTDVANIITFNSEIKMIVSMSKVWVSTSKNKDTGKYDYGVGLKLLQIEVTPSSSGSSIKNSFGTDAFLSEESDEDEQDNKLVSKTEGKGKEEEEEEYEEVEVEVEVEESESESEEVVIKTKSKAKKAKSQK